MASQSTGIQQLLHAEKKAAEKVSEARKRKNYTALQPLETVHGSRRRSENYERICLNKRAKAVSYIFF
jgi:hypothetical protein